MLDPSFEADRIALMEQAGCDDHCGLTWSVPHGDGEPALSHHRVAEERKQGKPVHTEIATIYVMPADFDLVAWLRGQHSD